ncbi:cysteine dioxygenase [Kitasatospora aureofaciens]|uniref:cysteine dioxygenase family protein n=1 Tax=Kitasatospora aureofaciens TaxID=1894 RepID=UPI0033B21DC0
MSGSPMPFASFSSPRQPVPPARPAPDHRPQPATAPGSSPRTVELAEVLTQAVRAAPGTEPADRTAERVARRLAGFLHHPDLLAVEHLQPSPSHYRQHVLHVDPQGRFSLVALVWLPGQATPVHDHTTWCVVGTYRGTEEETSYRFDRYPDGRAELKPVATTVNPPGTVTHLTPPGDIHLVRNGGDVLAVSLHVYGTDIRRHGSSIRRRYDFPGLPGQPL